MVSKDKRVAKERVAVSIGSEVHEIAAGTAVSDMPPKIAVVLERSGLLKQPAKAKERGSIDGNHQ